MGAKQMHLVDSVPAASKRTLHDDVQLLYYCFLRMISAQSK
jgi:hypothetical protein